MKRAIQGLLVTSILLIGCASTTVDTVAPEKRISESVSASELTDTRENLTGICVAMIRYGLPRDDQTRTHIEEKIEWLDETAHEQPELESTEGHTAEETLEMIEGGYRRCDPEVARIIHDKIEELDQA